MEKEGGDDEDDDVLRYVRDRIFIMVNLLVGMPVNSNAMRTMKGKGIHTQTERGIKTRNKIKGKMVLPSRRVLVTNDYMARA